jgi:hypothetical protein
MDAKDVARLQELGKQLAEVAALPVQREKILQWKNHNALNPGRPMVTIDQLPWHEINRCDEMQLLCVDDFCRQMEYSIKQLLYRWNHFPVDMVIENYIDIPMSVHNLNYGFTVDEETLATDDESDVVSHKYFDQVGTKEALDALKPDDIWVDREMDERHLDIAGGIFKDIMPVRLKGVGFHAGVWDRIAQARSVDKILWDLVDRPDFSKKIAKKYVDLSMKSLDQCEELGILDGELQYVHCTGAYTDELPADGFEPEKPRAKDCWAYGMAQLFSTVSPGMHEEYEIDIVQPLYDRFGLIYYGCCEPLDRKIGIIRKLKNVRKISISPWADIDRAAENIGGDYVFSSKPNPAFIASSFSEDALREQIEHVLKACRKNNCTVELILKDVSTVGNHLEYLDRWAATVTGMIE